MLAAVWMVFSGEPDSNDVQRTLKQRIHSQACRLESRFMIGSDPAVRSPSGETGSGRRLTSMDVRVLSVLPATVASARTIYATRVSFCVYLTVKMVQN